MLVVIAAIILLTGAGVDLLPVLIFALVAAIPMFVVFHPDRTWWGNDAKQVFTEPGRLARESRKDIRYFFGLLATVAVASAALVFAGVVHP